MMQALALVVVLAAQNPAARSPYIDAVARYGPGTERQAVATLLALRLRDVDRVFEELDRVCAAQGARTCMPRDLETVGPDVRDRIAGTWRQLYPRVMAVHAEALVAAGTTRDVAGVALHSGVLLRLAARCDEIARRADSPMTIAGLAITGRRLVLWALQYSRYERGLGDTLEILDRAKVQDVEVWLARGALAELRTRLDAIAATGRKASAAMERRGALRESASSSAQESAPTDMRLDGEVERRLDAAARVYRDGVAAHPEVPEMHLRLGRVLALLERVDGADRHLAMTMTLRPDPRQSYLAALFLGDLRERQHRPDDAMAAYASALQAWPGAQAPVVALARLRVLTGAADAGRATLAGLNVERDMRERSDPWLGYVGGQGWRLSGAIADLQRTFEPLR
jgi:tetratricopeptide (TPR) repeat protein